MQQSTMFDLVVVLKGPQDGAFLRPLQYDGPIKLSSTAAWERLLRFLRPWKSYSSLSHASAEIGLAVYISPSLHM